MDTIERVWPLLDEDQRGLLRDVALALAGRRPSKAPDFLTVSQIHEQYKRSTSAVYKAMDEGRLPYKVPNGAMKPRYASREDVETWLCMR